MKQRTRHGAQGTVRASALFHRGVFLRAFADVVLVQVALLGAFLIRLLVTLAADVSEAGMHQVVKDYLSGYARSSWLVCVLALLTFVVLGLYRRDGLYAKRKAWTLLHGVTFAYAGFAGMAFLLGNWFGAARGVIPLGWVMTLVTVGGARGFASLWREVVHKEHRLERADLSAIKVNSVLVIGGSGYIGSALIPRLLKQGYRVRVLDLMLFGSAPIEKWLDHPGLEVVKADFRFVDKVVEAMRGMDAAIHLGGLVGDPACSVDENLTIDINLAATRLLAQVARGEGIQRLIFASTCSVYGAADGVLSEESALNPVSLYARTKLASEQVLLEMAGDDFAPVILRFATVFGLSGRTRFDLVVNLLSAKAVTDGEITVIGGDQWRPFVHVDDVAEGVFRALRAPLDKVRGQVFNVGSNEQNYTIGQVAEHVQSLIPEARIIDLGAGEDHRNYRVMFDRIRDVLGFQPAWSLDDGITQVASALRSGNVRDYRSPEYSNVRALKEGQLIQLSPPEQDWPMQLLRKEQASRAATKPTVQIVPRTPAASA